MRTQALTWFLILSIYSYASVMDLRDDNWFQFDNAMMNLPENILGLAHDGTAFRLLSTAAEQSTGAGVPLPTTRSLILLGMGLLGGLRWRRRHA